jgi:hypothetical protein
MFRYLSPSVKWYRRSWLPQRGVSHWVFADKTVGVGAFADVDGTIVEREGASPIHETDTNGSTAVRGPLMQRDTEVNKMPEAVITL